MSASIVCGVDGSPDSRAALDVATRLATRLEARLVLAHVVQLTPSHPAAAGARALSIAPRPMLAALRDEQEEAGGQLLERISAEFGLDDTDRRVLVGFPAERLADLADSEGAELIVVGSRGRGRFRTAFLGSVSNSLLGVARCPVLIVPAGIQERELSSSATRVREDLPTNDVARSPTRNGGT